MVLLIDQSLLQNPLPKYMWATLHNHTIEEQHIDTSFFTIVAMNIRIRACYELLPPSYKKEEQQQAHEQEEWGTRKM
jgi:hypothetical protein